MMNFNPEVYNSLVEIDEVKSKKEYDKNKLSVLGNIIEKYGWKNDIIVSLTHRHFDLLPNEKMVADYNLITREWLSKPFIIDEKEIIPWNWKVGYDLKNKKWSWYPLDFLLDIPKFAMEKEIVNKLINDTSFLNELLIAIVKEKIYDIFGIALLMARFNEYKKEVVMFEKNDGKERTSKSFFISRVTLNNPDAVTQWHFKDNSLYKTGPAPLRWCDHL